MSNEKIKPKLNGTAETMLQCFYARAMHSRNPKNKFRDTKAEELIDRIDYDFSNAKKDTAMSGGIVARSVVFDELVSDFIRKNPDCTVVNIACGLDTRFYRMDNGKITWYNLDLPETIEVRDSIYQESRCLPLRQRRERSGMGRSGKSAGQNTFHHRRSDHVHESG